ncbi:pentapeptide repeat-containing protein [Roseibium marinum]|uniref:Pentapeptide repeat protein n=1 Tax=Roseibium marinum TaxID=281252 RepID=A0A2S3UJE9_9HYPH|nr:pentapeptide repeat-containing protein [Roseibium marinum]POF27838.1 pentapeptide repeat protein [Roseibium marinum]
MKRLWGYFQFRVGIWALIGVFLVVISLDIFHLVQSGLFSGANSEGAEPGPLGQLLVNILVESHGLLFDILLFGVVIMAFELRESERDQVKRHKEEIDDFRGWNEKEATYRIVGNIRRLNRLGEKDVDLSRTHLAGADLSRLELDGADLIKANLEGASLKNCSLVGAKLSGANMEGAAVDGADFTGAEFGNITAARAMKMLLVGDGDGKNMEDFSDQVGKSTYPPSIAGLTGWKSATFDEQILPFIRNASRENKSL